MDDDEVIRTLRETALNGPERPARAALAVLAEMFREARARRAAPPPAPPAAVFDVAARRHPAAELGSCSRCGGPSHRARECPAE
jgi:hypothetical protein